MYIQDMSNNDKIALLVYLYIHMCTYPYISVHMYVCIHIHTHIDKGCSLIELALNLDTTTGKKMFYKVP